MTGSTSKPVEAAEPARSRHSHRFWSLGVWAAVLLGIVGALLLLAVDLFPIITNDSLAYIGHSKDLIETGLIQIGYRQFGYPLFLAIVDAASTAVRLEPLLGTAVLQRLVYLSALGFGIWLWRWRALPLVALAVTPTLVVYTNFVLTEGLAIGLALWYAGLVGFVLRLSADTAAANRRDRLLIGTGTAITVVYFVLVAIRLQYILLGFGVLAALYAMYRAGNTSRKGAVALMAGLLIAGSVLIFAMSSENNREYGVFTPSARSERSQFWAAWQIVFGLEPENAANPTLGDLYAGGNPYEFMAPIDALQSYAAQRGAYGVALDRLIRESGTTWTAERLRSFIGVLGGGRFDDVQRVVSDAARTTYETVPDVMYRNSWVRANGTEPFFDHFNDGRPVQPIVISPAAPLRRAPYFTTILRWMLYASGIVLVAGVVLRRTRLLAIVGLATLLTTGTVFGFFLMDNVRFIIVPLMFVLAIATGVLDEGWRQIRLRPTGDRIDDRGGASPSALS